MEILGFNIGHDGHICSIKDGKLIYSYENEKDNGARYSSTSLTAAVTHSLQGFMNSDCIAVSGWAEGLHPTGYPIDGGYLGLNVAEKTLSTPGKNFTWVECSHEVSHIVSSYAMSKWADTDSCYVLLWEGYIGNFYFIDSNLNITLLEKILESPGLRYAFAYGLADPSFNLRPGYARLGDAGKMMALTGYGRKKKPTTAQQYALDYILSCESAITTLDKKDLLSSPLYNIGVESTEFCDFAKMLSDRLFEIFLDKVTHHVTTMHPLVISGGCGLNCEWNTNWRNSGLFSDVFIPPCTNDTGVGIGASAIAQKKITGKVAVDWSVYSGQNFVFDTEITKFSMSKLDFREICRLLLNGEVICWVQGRCEIGPRALGNRSMLAAPFDKETAEKINRIKQREKFRPVAPVCLQEDASLHFEGCIESKFMLEFFRVINPDLQAVTHIDGTARVQTVSHQDNVTLYQLLCEFKKQTGIGVLCNTSLNEKGKGFINRLSDLEEFCANKSINRFVVNDVMYTARSEEFQDCEST
ncbi:proline dehydrogenase [Pseudomonas sp. MG-9]|uniref:carbamoyltransferase C-terminal domain-containing protein n=1 Tax=Pseudomonas sp. MG-9 TaxID=2839032 RepID=UPI001BFFEC5C|nr:proline dehydrogenase [Pseudomonas sp. MG-9]